MNESVYFLGVTFYPAYLGLACLTLYFVGLVLTAGFVYSGTRRRSDKKEGEK